MKIEEIRKLKKEFGDFNPMAETVPAAFGLDKEKIKQKVKDILSDIYRKDSIETIKDMLDYVRKQCSNDNEYMVVLFYLGLVARELGMFEVPETIKAHVMRIFLVTLERLGAINDAVMLATIRVQVEDVWPHIVLAYGYLVPELREEYSVPEFGM